MSAGVGMRVNIPYLQGAYLALNAVPDAYFVGDGPTCLFDKAAQIHARHDLFSTLLSCESRHRVQLTGVNVFNMVGNTESTIAVALKRVAAYPECGAVFLGSMPMCAIAGTDYERVLREALEGCGKPFFTLPRRSALSGDWLDGYDGLLTALAKGLALDAPGKRPGAVAVVGYLMDRNEGEHWGNLRELARMLRALDLEPVSIWPSGKTVEELRAVAGAETIISLPHGRKTAAALASRLGARLVQAELPFGLEASRRFIELLGRELGREERARAFVEAELDWAAPRLEWVVPHCFLRRRFAFAGDPFHAEAFAEQIEGLGGVMAGLLVLGGARHLPEERRRALAARPGTLFEPVASAARAQWTGLAGDGPEAADLIVGSAFAFQELPRGQRWLEFGYPSESTHFLDEEPFLGFRGAVRFAGRLANEVARGLMRGL